MRFIEILEKITFILLIGTAIGLTTLFSFLRGLKKPYFGAFKKKGLQKINDLRRQNYSSCPSCKGEGMDGGCPTCANWSGLGPHQNVEGREYFLITNTKKRSFYYVYHVLLKILGRKVLFDKAKTSFGGPMPSNWIAVWVAPKI